MNQKSLNRSFQRAIKAGNIGKARDLVTHMDPHDSHTRVGAYRAIVDRSIKLGKLDDAQEAAQFCGYVLTEKDYWNCLRLSCVQGNIDTVFQCLDTLGISLDIDQVRTLYRTHFGPKYSTDDLPKLIRQGVSVLLANVSMEDLPSVERLQVLFGELTLKQLYLGR